MSTALRAAALFETEVYMRARGPTVAETQKQTSLFEDMFNLSADKQRTSPGEAEATGMERLELTANACSTPLRLLNLLDEVWRASLPREVFESAEFRSALSLSRRLLIQSWGGGAALQCDTKRVNAWWRALHQTAIDNSVLVSAIQPDGPEHMLTLELMSPARTPAPPMASRTHHFRDVRQVDGRAKSRCPNYPIRINKLPKNELEAGSK